MKTFGIESATAQAPRCCMGASVITDAERFTSIAEGIDPASAVALINRYLESLFRPVYAHGGFVSDVKGDGMLAVWTDASPGAELRARVCRACLEMADNAARFGRGVPAHGLSTRIGAYFGPLALAAVGALAHFEYRAVGDTVNTSSRLEQLNKQLGTRVLVSATLAEGLDEFLFRDLGEFELRGKRNRVRVFELLARRDAASAQQIRLCEDYAAALDAQRDGRWREARALSHALCARNPHDRPARRLRQRCEETLAARARCAGLARRLAPARAGFALGLASLEA